MFVDLFDTVGTVIGVAHKGNLLDKDGKLPKVGRVLLADALGTCFGAVMGTSTVTSYVESSAGVAQGGRTGLTSVVTALLFIVSLVLSPTIAISEDKVITYGATGEDPMRTGNAHPLINPYDILKCKNGYVAMGISSDAQWTKFCKAFNVLEWDEDER